MDTPIMLQNTERMWRVRWHTPSADGTRLVTSTRVYRRRSAALRQVEYGRLIGASNIEVQMTVAHWSSDPRWVAEETAP